MRFLNLLSLTFCLLVVSLICHDTKAKTFDTKEIKEKIDWKDFMSHQDMLWNKVPKRWNEAPFFGNGMIGLFLYQEINNVDNIYSTSDKNTLSLHLGRGDYYDNRPPLGSEHHTWIYRGRLPIGFFRIKSKGDITGVNWRMDLWNARLIGTVNTTMGTYQIEGKVHATYDSFFWKVIPSEKESVNFEWQAQEAYSFAKNVSEKVVERAKSQGKNDSEISHFYTSFAATPYPAAPKINIEQTELGNFSTQELYAKSGEQITAWKIIEDTKDHSKTLVGTIAFSKEMGVSRGEAEKNLSRSLKEIKKNTYHSSHEEWWHSYYPQSFVSMSDDFWEQFYWIQIYKYASATRANGMLLDTYGPWYQPGFHPLVWSDLNVQLDYWLPLTANRLDVGSSVMNKMDEGMQNMILNMPKDWQNDCLNAGTVFPGDFRAPAHKIPADHIVWLLHNYWLFCQYGNDQQRMKDGLFPLLKRANATYLRFIKERPLNLNDGKIHILSSWSPEAATGPDMNYTIALIRWSTKTLLEINERHQLHDPKEAEWKNLLENLVEYQIDDNGLRLGKDHPFEHSHRHYSHLLGFYPLYDLNAENNRDLVRTSLDHWLKVTENPDKKKDQAMSVTGYTCSGAASMYASLGDAEKAYEYLQKFSFVNIYGNTLYSEGKEQLIETPLSAAASIHDMMLQSWGGKIRIMPAIPEAWKDVHFQDLLCEGGAEVSADRSNGKLGYAEIKSPDISRTLSFNLPISQASFFVKKKKKLKEVKLKKGANGFYTITLDADASLVIREKKTDLISLQPVKTPLKLHNIFGNNGQYEKVRSTFKSQYHGG